MGKSAARARVESVQTRCGFAAGPGDRWTRPVHDAAGCPSHNLQFSVDCNLECSLDASHTNWQGSHENPAVELDPAFGAMRRTCRNGVVCGDADCGARYIHN